MILWAGPDSHFKQSLPKRFQHNPTPYVHRAVAPVDTGMEQSGAHYTECHGPRPVLNAAPWSRLKPCMAGKLSYLSVISADNAPLPPSALLSSPLLYTPALLSITSPILFYLLLFIPSLPTLHSLPSSLLSALPLPPLSNYLSPISLSLSSPPLSLSSPLFPFSL